MKTLAGAVFLLPGVLQAAISGPAITSSDYRVDVGQPVALGSTRHIGMGGADVALAHGAEALSHNPAAAAARLPGAPAGFDWDGALSSFVVAGRDLDNNGSASTAYGKHMVTQLGGLAQPGKWGVGALGTAQQYDIETAGVPRRLQFNQSLVVAGRRSARGRFAWAAGFRVAELKMTTRGSSAELLHLSGSGLVLGGLWAPEGPWRFGGALCGAIKDDPRRSLPAGSAVTVGGLIVPRGVTVPPSLSGGVAYAGGGSRPWTAAADLHVMGVVEDAVGIESFLEQRVQRSGRRPSLSPRLGIEGEVLPGRLRLRAGAYREPSRFSGLPGRTHGTAGAEWKLFRLPFFGGRSLSLGYALDAAPRYVANFISLGFWH